VPAGHEIAREQLQFSNGSYFANSTSRKAKLKIEKDGNKLKFTAEDVAGEFGTRQGRAW